MPLDFATLEALQKGPRSVVGDRSRWYACRTRSRSEKAAARALERRNVECYLPLLAKRSRWADRTVSVSVPLFPGYLFVRCERESIGAVLAAPGLVDVVRVNGEPSEVRETELDAVRAVLEGVRRTGALPSHADFLVVGDEVRVTRGPFAGLRGVLAEERGRARVVIRLSAIRQAVSVELDRRWLRHGADLSSR